MSREGLNECFSTRVPRGESKCPVVLKVKNSKFIPVL